MLGANLVATARDRHEVVATCYENDIEFDGVQTLCGDLSVPGTAAQIMEQCRPQWVVHCAAATQVDACERDPDMADRLNCKMAASVAEAAWALDARLIHISTDAVFDGERGGYSEADEPNPISIYGRSKLDGEQAVVEAHPQATIVRTNFYGWNLLPKQSLAEWFLAHLEVEKPCQGFSDVWVSILLVNDLAGILLDLLEKDLPGLYHVGSSDCVSKYEFGISLARVFGLSTDLIKPISIDQLQLPARRAKRLCLRGEKVERVLSAKLPKIEAGLKRFRALREHGYPDQLRAQWRRVS